MYDHWVEYYCTLKNSRAPLHFHMVDPKDAIRSQRNRVHPQFSTISEAHSILDHQQGPAEHSGWCFSHGAYLQVSR